MGKGKKERKGGRGSLETLPGRALGPSIEPCGVGKPGAEIYGRFGDWGVKNSRRINGAGRRGVGVGVGERGKGGIEVPS